MQGQYGLLAGQNGVGVLPQTVPVPLHGSHLRLHGLRCRGHATLLVAVGQIAPAGFEVVACLAQQTECLGSTGGRFGGVLGNTLRQNPQLTGVADVFRIVVGLRIDVGEVGEQQHDGDDQDDKQPGDQRTAARTRE
ncbi:hypothetical protein D3C80_1752980 [compost metagenome]